MTHGLNPFSSVSMFPSVGPAYSKRLERLAIYSIRDLLYHFPQRYVDYSQTKTIGSLTLNDLVTITGNIKEIKNIYTKGFKKLTKLTLEDKTGLVECIFFNQHFLTRTLKNGMSLNIAGRVGEFNKKVAFINPDYEINNVYKIHTNRIIPIYPETSNVSSKWLRTKIYHLLYNTELELINPLTSEIEKKYQFLDYMESLKQIHFPTNLKTLEKAKERLAFEEIFINQLVGQVKKQLWGNRGVAKKLIVDGHELLDFIAKLPYNLTNDQLKVSKEILNDLAKETPTNRLLQGDVGSGKTVVAALAMYTAFKTGVSSVFMAPTEILAFQHFETLNNIFKSLDLPTKINLLTGTHKKVDTSNTSITIGTHAILFNKKLINNVGLVIIDEQHKFGVEQRKKILDLVSQKNTPHLLTMTATPIPRSLALTLYGELDISTIDEMPQGRLPVKTFIVEDKKRGDCYEYLKKEIKNNEAQVYIVCPFVDESEMETLKNIESANRLYSQLKNKEFNDFAIEMMHGRLKSKEKNEIINRFSLGKTPILVATPVVEVGMDIPNANIMVIEGAERFGLASLHQLRGRVGRRHKQAYCFLFTTKGVTPNVRLKKFCETSSGLKLAEIDLKQRGPGEFYGVKQHGKNKFRLFDFSNTELLESSYKSAVITSQNLNKYSELKKLLNLLSPDTIAPN